MPKRPRGEKRETSGPEALTDEEFQELLADAPQAMKEMAAEKNRLRKRNGNA